MQVIIITSGSYPYGGAATNRHLSYLKGLANIGAKIKLIIVQPDNNNQSTLSNKQFGVFEGVDFEYMTWKSNQQKRSKVVKLFAKIKAHYLSIKKIKNTISKNGENTKLIILFTNPFEILLYLFFCRFHKIQFFHERTEYPFIGKNGFLSKLSLKFYLKCIIPKFDGLYVISKSLEKYFSDYVNKKETILHLPMTVDLERFTNMNKTESKYGKYIAYCGSMYTDKDGIPDLIEAFNLFAKENIDTNLLLIGDTSDKNKFKLISNCINSSPFKNRIYTTGWIDRDEMPILLINAEILALARPDNIQAKGGFPTKLGEYLATGNPVVITDVGEHTEYLTDGVSAYISSPDNPSHFAEKLIQASRDLTISNKIGLNGKKIATQFFNNQIQSEKLYHFLNSKTNND